jgi:hypothetical protein
MREGTARVSWSVLSALIALAITFVAMQSGVVVIGTIRRRDYHRFEDSSKDIFADQFPISTIDQSPAEGRRKTLAPSVDTAHKTANAAQTTYHNAVVRSSSCLVVAFIALVPGTLPQQDWELERWLPANNQSVEHVLTWLDAIAIIFVLALFLYARKSGKRWIAARATAELLRQYQFLNVIFPGASFAAHIEEVKPRFYLDINTLKALPGEPRPPNLLQIERLWSERKASIQKRAPTEWDLQADALMVYLKQRARRQLGWFADSKARLEHIAERRNIVLLSLYCVAVGLAVLKLALFLHMGHSPAYLVSLLLIVTGISAAMTAYYINQNSRSLIHRYNTQQRRTAEWLKAFNEHWNFVDLPSMTIDAAAKIEMRARILQFEDLMIEELIDWLHITSHDAIELAP